MSINSIAGSVFQVNYIDAEDAVVETTAESIVHAADMLYRIKSTAWQVYQVDKHGVRVSVSKLVQHLLAHYVAPCYEMEHNLDDLSAFIG